MTSIRTVAPVNLIVHLPKTVYGKGELARRVADLHADLSLKRIGDLNWSSDQKTELVNQLMTKRTGH